MRIPSRTLVVFIAVYNRTTGRLKAASAHWMRHTAGSNMTSGDMDIRHVRDNLGHESIATTNYYLHSEDDKRHKDTEEHHKLNW